MPRPPARSAVDEVEPRGSQCRNHTRQRRREKGDTRCERHHGDVDANGFRTRQAVGHEHHDGLQAPARQPEADNGRGKSHHEALGEELRDQLVTAGTERCPYGELGPPTFAAHQEEVRDVGTGDREDEADGHKEHAESGVDVSDDHVLEGTNHWTKVDKGSSGYPSIEVRHHRGELVGRVRNGDAVAQTPQDLDVAQDAGAERLVAVDIGQRVERRPDLGPARVREIRGHDPCHSEGLVLQVQRLPEGFGCCGKQPHPRAIGEHDQPLGATAIVLDGQRSADLGPHAGHVEEPTHHSDGLRGDPDVANAPVLLERAVVADTRDLLERAARASDLLDVCGSIRYVRGEARARHAPRHHKAVLVRNRQRSEQDAANQREHHRGACHAQRECQDGTGVKRLRSTSVS